jgi:hypothetical protein
LIEQGHESGEKTVSGRTGVVLFGCRRWMLKIVAKPVVI